MKKLTHISPREIESIINKSIIGQTDGVRTISKILSAHINRIIYNQSHPDSKIKKDLLLIAGNTGCGKTEAISVALKALDMPIPYAVIASNTLTAVGYRGKNTDSILLDLVASAKSIIYQNMFDYISVTDYRDEKKRATIINNAIIKLCETGIICLDEFDKLSPSQSASRDDGYASSLLNNLLRIVEGGRGFSDDELCQQIDTSDIQFVFAGAFTDLLNPKPAYEIGFGAEAIATPSVDVPSTKDLLGYGIGLELCGRITQRCRFYDLTEDDLYKILTESNISPTYDYERLIEQTSNKLHFDESAYREIARRAIAIGTGARGLKTVLGNSMLDILYDVDGVVRDSDIFVTADVISGNCKPEIKKHVNTKNVIYRRQTV